MAESASPTVSRSQHKLEYASSINTTVSSSTSMQVHRSINTHSSFDLISEAREYDASLSTNYDHQAQHHRILERDLCRLDIESDKFSIEMHHKKLASTESISLPTTPVEQISSSFNTKCHPMISTSLNNNNSIDESEQDFRLTPSNDCKFVLQEPVTNVTDTNSKR